MTVPCPELLSYSQLQHLTSGMHCFHTAGKFLQLVILIVLTDTAALLGSLLNYVFDLH